MVYGVVPTGFERKRLPELLVDLEAAMVAAFGPGVIQTSQSPLGQINGLMADILADTWEITEDTYQSFDVDQATGPRLDMLAKLRRLQRNDGELDADFQARITNQGQADIRLAANMARLAAIDGVTFVWAIENAGATTSSLGMPPHSVAYAVTGGDDAEVALAVYQLSVPGIELIGNSLVNVVADGYCRIVTFIRPALVRIRVEVDVRAIPTSNGCAPPNTGTLAAGIIAAFAGAAGFKNGEAVTRDRIESEAAQLGDLKIVDVRIARVSNVIEAETLPMTLYERAVILSPDVVVRYV